MTKWQILQKAKISCWLFYQNEWWIAASKNGGNLYKSDWFKSRKKQGGVFIKAREVFWNIGVRAVENVFCSSDVFTYIDVEDNCLSVAIARLYLMKMYHWLLFCIKSKGIFVFACLNLPVCIAFLFIIKFITEFVFYINIGYGFLLRKCIYYIRRTVKTYIEDFWYFWRQGRAVFILVGG